MPKVLEANLLAEGKKFALVVSRFNDFITNRLKEGAVDGLLRFGARDEDIEIVKVPGAFEIPLLAKKMAATGRYSAVICLGAVIRGATPHFDYVSAEVSKGIAMVSLDSGIPVIFGIAYFNELFKNIIINVQFNCMHNLNLSYQFNYYFIII